MKLHWADWTKTGQMASSQRPRKCHLHHRMSWDWEKSYSTGLKRYKRNQLSYAHLIHSRILKCLIREYLGVHLGFFCVTIRKSIKSISYCWRKCLLNITRFYCFKENSSARFTHIAAMHSELMAVNTNGQLCQWKWSDPEPFHNKDVSKVLSWNFLSRFISAFYFTCGPQVIFVCSY